METKASQRDRKYKPGNVIYVDKVEETREPDAPAKNTFMKNAKIMEYVLSDDYLDFGQSFI